MTMTEWILNILDNFAQANRNKYQAGTNSAYAAKQAEKIADKLRKQDMLDYHEISALADYSNVEPTTSEEIKWLRDRLHIFIGIATSLQLVFGHDETWPLQAQKRSNGQEMMQLDSQMIYSSKELNVLPSIKNWAQLKDWSAVRNGKLVDTNYIQTQERIYRDMGKAVDDGITQLEEANQNVRLGSQQYKDFLRAMRELQQMKSKGNSLNLRENDAIDKQYAKVLKLGQAYLKYKANDRRTINEKGQKRIRAVNEIVNKLTVLQIEEQQNYSLSMTRAEANRRIKEQERYNQRREEERKKTEEIKQKLEREKREKEEREKREKEELEKKLNEESQERQQEEERREKLIKDRAPKNTAAVKENPAIVKQALEYLRNRKNATREEYVDAWQQLEAYKQLEQKKPEGFHPVEGFHIDDDEYKRIGEMANVSKYFMVIKNLDKPDEAYSWSEIMSYLYEIHVAPDYIKDKNRTSEFTTDDDFDEKDGRYYELAQTKAFQDYKNSLYAEDSGEYHKLLNNPEYQEQRFKKLLEDSTKELQEKYTHLKERIDYLKDYRNVLEADYASLTADLQKYMEYAKKQDKCLGKPAREDSEILRDDLDLSKLQYEKICKLGGEYGDDARLLYAKQPDAASKNYTVKRALRVFCDLCQNPVFCEFGNEEPLPDKLGGVTHNSYLSELDGVKTLEEQLNTPQALYEFIHDTPRVADTMDELFGEVNQKGLLSEETMERERGELASSVKYLLDYKNMIHPEYATEYKKLLLHLNKAAVLNRKNEELEALDLSEKQLKKISILSGGIMTAVRTHMNMSPEEIAEKAQNSKEDLLGKTLGILSFTYFTKSMSEAGNTMPVPRSIPQAEKIMEEMEELLADLPEVKALRHDMDLTTTDGCKKLYEFNTSPKVQLGLMRTLMKAAVRDKRFEKAKQIQPKNELRESIFEPPLPKSNTVIEQKPAGFAR